MIKLNRKESCERLLHKTSNISAGHASCQLLLGSIYITNPTSQPPNACRADGRTAPYYAKLFVSLNKWLYVVKSAQKYVNLVKSVKNKEENFQAFHFGALPCDSDLLMWSFFFLVAPQWPQGKLRKKYGHLLPKQGCIGSSVTPTGGG